MAATLLKLGLWVVGKVYPPAALWNWRLIARIGLMLAIVAMTAWLLWSTYQAGKHRCELDAQAAEVVRLNGVIEHQRLAIEEANKINAALLAKLADQQAAHQKNEEILRHELSSNPVYASCVVPARGVQLLNAAIKAANQ